MPKKMPITSIRVRQYVQNPSLSKIFIKIGAALFLPQDMKADVKYPAIIVGHPMGAVKEQSANLYATKMAERGFVTLSIDLTY